MRLGSAAPAIIDRCLKGGEHTEAGMMLPRPIVGADEIYALASAKGSPDFEQGAILPLLGTGEH
jgi:hypothetical protein